MPKYVSMGGGRGDVAVWFNGVIRTWGEGKGRKHNSTKYLDKLRTDAFHSKVDPKRGKKGASPIILTYPTRRGVSI